MTETQSSIIYSMALSHALDADLVRAICEAETGANPLAARYEPAWQYFVTPDEFARGVGSSLGTEMTLQAVSWGPMQLMGSNARALGFKGWLPALASWSLGLDYGCQFLKNILKRHPVEADAIAAYNQGSVRMAPTGAYVNQPYVDRVAGFLRELRQP